MKKIWLFLASFLLIAGCTTTNPGSTSLGGTTSEVSSQTSQTTKPSTGTSSNNVTTGGSSSNTSSDISSDNTSSNSSSNNTSSGSSSNNTSTSTSSNNTSSGSISNSTSSGSSTEKPIAKLEAPILTINEETGIVTWDSIKDATHYNYIINDGDIQTSTTSTIALSDRSTISVQAANASAISDWSNPITYFDVNDIIVPAEKTIHVTFHNTTLSPISLTSGKTVAKPNDPIKNNYTFDNWYADPFYKEVFDFNTPLYDSTIIYANYTPNELIDNVYFWIKGDNLMSSSIQSTTTAHDWRFIPMHVNKGQHEFKEFMATITVSGATTAEPCNFIIMDGFDNNPGRNYWKYNGQDFSITTDGIYNIYFSVEHLHKLNGVTSNVWIELAPNSASTIKNLHPDNTEKLSTPLVNINEENDIASWDKIDNADGYEVVINNRKPLYLTETNINLNKKEHITVRAISEDYISSNWSIPKANLNYVQENNNPIYAYVYYHDSNLSSQKVSLNTPINVINNPTKEGFVFDGWYLDIALTKPVVFPYIVTKNTVFYPKWTKENYQTDIYYNLCDNNGNIIKGLTWNLDNYNFLEYETGRVTLQPNTNYYIKNLDSTKTWGPYTVSSIGYYKIYFSEENVWDVGSDNARNVYIAKDTITIYFSNSMYWSGTIKAYMWKDGNPVVEWPGSDMTFHKTNSYGQDIYEVTVDLYLADYIIFNDGSSQTVDIPLSDVKNGTGFYANDEKDEKGHNTVSSYQYK